MNSKLEYSTFSKAVSIFISLFSLFVLYAATKSCQSQRVVAYFVATSFITASLYAIYKTFFTCYIYDKEKIYSCNKKEHYLWSNLEDIGFKNIRRAIYLKFSGSKTLYLYEGIGGLEELFEFLEKNSVIDKEFF